jgi:hypothetical protein
MALYDEYHKIGSFLLVKPDLAYIYMVAFRGDPAHKEDCGPLKDTHKSADF